MILLLLELLFLGMGIYSLITAKLPSWFVGKGFIAEGNPVRLLGALMITPFPISICAGLVIGIIDPDSIAIGSAIEIISTITVAIIVVVVLNKIRKPVTPKLINQQPNQE